MGGFGSTRWQWHTKKTTVEACHKLDMARFSDIFPGNSGVYSWTWGSGRWASVNYSMQGDSGQVKKIRLSYQKNGQPFEYSIPIVTTETPWGSPRYWFICPVAKNGNDCGRRVRCLYLPPGGDYFACRHCYDLTYRSSQEERADDRFYRMTAGLMQDSMPGVTPDDLRYAFRSVEDRVRGRFTPPPPGGYCARKLQESIYEWLQEQEEERERHYAGYLTAGEICERSGLTSDQLQTLEAARLLLPDHEGRYRPKLAGWAGKLAYLIGEGWSVEEVRAWAKGRWSSPDPRRWPPERAT